MDRSSLDYADYPFFASRWAPILLAAMAALLFSARLGCELLEPEEARYAEIPRQMLEHGRFVTPVLHGEDYYQKPPLFYWLVMLSYQVFGVHDWAARLVPCSCGVLVVLLTYGWGRRTVSPAAGFAAALIVCLSARFLYLGGMLSIDSLLSLWVVAGLAFGHVALTEKRLSLWLLSALACGLGFLTKGPVAAILVLAPMGIWMVLNRGEIGMRWKWLFLYTLVVAATAAPWYIASALRDPQAVGAFFWLHNIVRYLAPFDHAKTVWFYLPSLFIGMLPWSLLIAPAGTFLWRTDTASKAPGGMAVRFFALAFAWCVLFYSLSGCKRAAYILPAFPLLSLMLGAYLAHGLKWHTWTSRARTWLPMAGASGTLFVILLIGSYCYLPQYHRRFGMREQVQAQLERAQDQQIRCYPKRWDSVGFYLRCEVGLVHFDEGIPSGLLFVKREKGLAELTTALPSNWRFVQYGPQGQNVAVGVVGPNDAVSSSR